MIKTYLGLQKFFLACSLLVFIGFKHGNQSYLAEDNVFRTHQAPPKPISISTEKNVLLIGLRAYLGKEVKNEKESIPLRLVSNGRTLILRDASGVIRKAKEINIGWQKKQLKHPYHLFRKVIGPLASFESAERLFKDLKIKGIQSTIAHPMDWEVWVPGDSHLPKSIQFTYQKIKVTDYVVPFLYGNNGKITLKGPLSLAAPDGLLWGNGIYSGPFSIQLDAYGTWTLVEHVPLERYLNGVVPYEIGSHVPPAALEAQAVLARTWAIANSHRFKVDGYNLCSDTQCQVYKDPSKVSPAIKKAISETSGQILSWKGSPINAVYHASNGGVMGSFEEAWTVSPVPYLKTSLDGSLEWSQRVLLPLTKEENLKLFLSADSGPNGSGHRLFRWERKISSDALEKYLQESSGGSAIGVPIQIEVLERGQSGRVLTLKIYGNNEKSIILQRDSIRRVLRNLPSTLFYIDELQKGFWQFTGGGFGHGVGMSQSGAIDLAIRGWSTKQILLHYYPGTKYGFLP